MVKKFVIPPLPFEPKKAIPIDLDKPCDRRRFGEAMGQRGVYVIVGEVSSAFIPYVEKKLAKIVRSDMIGDADEAGNYRSPQEIGRLIAETIAFCYVGRRLGAFAVRVVDSDMDGKEMPPARNDTGFILSQWLKDLSTIVGEKAAGEIFRKLETVTNDVLRRNHGRPR